MLKRLARLFRGTGASAKPAAPPPQAPQSPALDALLAAPIAAIRAGRGDDAIPLLEAVLEEHPDAADAHLMLGTVFHERKRREDARDHYLLASSFRPDWWSPHHHLGLLALDEGRYAEALAPLEKARALGARDARAHNALGAARLYADNIPGAVEQFRKALELEPDLVQAHSNLGYALFRDLEDYEGGALHIERAMALAPRDPAVRCNWVMVLHQRGHTEEALALCDELLARDPGLVEARVNKALILLKRRDFALGWPEYEARKASPRSKCANDLPWPEWDGSALAGRSIFVYPEQGLGDEIMFASCVPDVIAQAGSCTVECHPKLEKIFRRSFPQAEVLRKDAWRSAPRIAEHPPDWKVATGSLPLFFRTRAADFPAHRGYLHADAARMQHWRERLAALPGRLKVGISWRGGLASTRRSLRSIALARWLPILSVPGIDFVSLQYSDPDREVEALRASGGPQVHVWQDAIDDYDETAALVCALDLVVSVQTAVVHLSGALGREAWALIPAAPEWRYGDEGASMPWYPTVRLLRQTEPGNWEPLIAGVAEDLRGWAGAPAG